jgi:transketolase C-terminal domain/subunit
VWKPSGGKAGSSTATTWSRQPLDLKTLRIAARETGRIITAEDHYQAGGMGEAVAAAPIGPSRKGIHTGGKKDA